MDMEILKQYKIIALTVVLCVCISACRKKDATVKLPEVPSKLVLVSFISPQDTIIKVTVSLSQPLYNNINANTFGVVADARVVISSALGSAELSYDAFSKSYLIYTTALQIVEGMTYKITVSTPDGKYAEASTSIPSRNTSLNFSIPSDSTSLICHWNDSPSGKDYYRLFLQNSSYYLFEGYNQGGSFSDTIQANYVSTAWVTDEERDGGTLTTSMEYLPMYFQKNSRQLYLLHVSKEYYDYGTRLPQAENGNGPFTEPVMMYSNVSGGFGIFAGYNGYKLTVP